MKDILTLVDHGRQFVAYVSDGLFYVYGSVHR